MKKWTTVASLALLMVCLGFAQASEEAAKTLYNDKCPISGRAVKADKTSDFKVEFCCKNCKGKFDKDPAKHLAKAEDAEPGTCIFNGKEAKTSTTLTIGFCCGGCKGKFDEDPRKMIAKVKPAETESE